VAALLLLSGALLWTAIPGAAAAQAPVSGHAGHHEQASFAGSGGSRPAPYTPRGERRTPRSRPGQRAVPAGDELVTGLGDRSGWHLYAASSGDGWRWHALATLRPGGEETWIGQQCLTGNGRYVIAVVAPWHANNSEAGMDAGAFAYAVNAHTGKTRPLASGVSVAHFDPGCGTGSQVALTTYLGRDQRTTRVTILEAATGRVLRSATVQSEVTSAVPVGTTITAARGGTVVELVGHRMHVVGRVTGQAFDLRPDRAGRVDLLAATGQTARIWLLTDGTLRPLGDGPLGRVRLLEGRAGHNVVTGATRLVAGSGLVAVRSVADPVQASASLAGTMVLASAAARPSAPPGYTAAATLTLQPGGGGPALGSRIVPSSSPVEAAIPALDLAAQTGTDQTVRQAANTTTPACSVPRNDLWTQVPQPNSAQVRWAVGQAVHGWLTPSNIPARPPAAQNYKIGDDQPLPSYYPSQDFPPAALSGHPGAAVPAQVMYGIFAQESNWNQASFHALAGYAGNPLIANYYGSSDPANPSDIDYDNADCGYGIGQLTDIMRAGALGQAVQVAVATDYTENIAAAAQALALKWNQLAGLGITMNNGDPSKLENWYAAIWAYNSGVHLTTSGDPANGLGWFNNPANPIWLTGRHPFLHTFDATGNPVETFTDASTPQDWPYQEKVFGWMETPQFDPNYDPSHPTSPPTDPLRYAGTYDWADGSGQFLALPGAGTFCRPGVNNCTPSAIGGSDPCPPESAACWWDAPAQWATCATDCTPDPAAPPSPGTPEPASTERGIPCGDTGGLKPGTTVVDDTAVASQNPGRLDPNAVGCPTSPAGWSSGGSFELDTNNGTPGQPGHQIGVSDPAGIDLHQVGAGFGGHIWFTHTRPASDAGREVVARWQSGLPAGVYRIEVYVPSPGATTTSATYQVHLSGSGPVIRRTIDQDSYGNQWVSLGLFPLGAGGYVTLGSVTSGTDASQGADIAFDAMAFTPVPVSHGITVISDPGTDYSFDGWGTSLAWWAEAMGGGPNTGGPWQAGRQAAVERALFDPPGAGGLGLTVLRYNIGASPATLARYPATCWPLRPGGQIPSPQQASGGAIDITRDNGQLSVLKAAIADIQAGGGFARLEAFANSPPWWMTISGCPYGNVPAFGVDKNDNLSPDFYDAYPAYLTQVLQKFEAAGIHFQTVEPFNEPWASFPWPNPTCNTSNSCQEGANFDPGLQDAQLQKLCRDLASAGLTTGVAAPDGNTVSETISDATSYGAASRGCVSQLNTHGYSSPTTADEQVLNGLAGAGRDLWMSEYGIGVSKDYTGPPANDIGSALTLSQQIAQDLGYLRPQAWVYWQAVEHTGGWGLLEDDSFPADAPVSDDISAASPAIRPTMRYYALGQYSEFIRPGFQILSATDPGGNACGRPGTPTVAAYNPNGGQIVIVTTNCGASQTVAFDLSQLSAAGIPVGSTAHVYRTDAEAALLSQRPDITITDDLLQDSEPAQDITTYVIDPPSAAAARGGHRSPPA
jgi:O-glycosyl hydrolase